ncbi:MAG TPA: ATP-binding protein [Candidatus Limnocylindrales bacterium]|nr:ATP-binding protein [Candidatus Limnocylindrales bacterium]
MSSGGGLTAEPIRILLVEDDEDDAFLLQRALTKAAPGQFEISRVGTLDAARRTLISSPFHVVLSDLSLPDSRGFDTFEKIHEADPEVAIVVLTGNDDERLAVRALNEGAQDYLVKGKADGQSLVRSMRYAIERNRSRRLERDNTALEGEIRARKLAQERLERVAAQLEASNRELQQFASVASHDLQEPLRKIVVFGDRLRQRFDGQLGDQGNDYIERMMNAAGRMQTLIDDLLEFSRVVTRARPFVPVDLGEVVREVLGDLEVLIESKGAVVDVGPMPTLQADPTQFRQVFQNLIANAMKFQGDGAVPHVVIRAEPATCAGSPGWKLTVKDNGIGFEQQHAERIFAPFQRLHGRSEFGGSGIGLAIVRRIVERHSGTILAESSPGHGAMFTILMPAEGDAAVTAA